MAIITGDIGLMPVSDVVAWIANRKHTCTLSVRRRGAETRFVIRGGLAWQAASSDPREYLGQHLINFGYINEGHLEKAFETQRETHVPLGRVLVMVDAITREQLSRVLVFKTRESLLETLCWTDGVFRVSTEVPEERDLDCDAPIDLLDVHSEGMARSAMWAEIRKVFTTDTVRADVVGDVDSVDNPFDRRLLQLMRAGKSIGEAALELRAMDFPAYARLYDLYNRKVVRPKAPAMSSSSSLPRPIAAQARAVPHDFSTDLLQVQPDDEPFAHQGNDADAPPSAFPGAFVTGGTAPQSSMDAGFPTLPPTSSSGASAFAPGASNPKLSAYGSGANSRAPSMPAPPRGVPLDDANDEPPSFAGPSGLLPPTSASMSGVGSSAMVVASTAAQNNARDESELADAMRASLANRDWNRALVLAQQLLERDPLHSEAIAAHRVAEVQLRRTDDDGESKMSRVPTLLIDPAKVQSGSYSSKERYVLSRVDGRRTLRQIAAVSPIQRDELNRIVEAFVRNGVVRLTS
jgi:hypothetical protein